MMINLMTLPICVSVMPVPGLFKPAESRDGIATCCMKSSRDRQLRAINIAVNTDSGSRIEASRACVETVELGNEYFKD